MTKIVFSLNAQPKIPFLKGLKVNIMHCKLKKIIHQIIITDLSEICGKSVDQRKNFLSKKALLGQRILGLETTSIKVSCL